MKVVNIPTLTAADPAERLIEFYIQLGWNGESELDPTLVRLTREDAVALLDAELQYARKSRPDDPTAMARTGLLWMNWGPSSQGKTPGKVELHRGWIKNAA